MTPVSAVSRAYRPSRRARKVGTVPAHPHRDPESLQEIEPAIGEVEVLHEKDLHSVVEQEPLDHVLAFGGRRGVTVPGRELENGPVRRPGRWSHNRPPSWWGVGDDNGPPGHELVAVPLDERLVEHADLRDEYGQRCRGDRAGSHRSRGERPTATPWVAAARHTPTRRRPPPGCRPGRHGGQRPARDHRRVAPEPNLDLLIRQLSARPRDPFTINQHQHCTPAGILFQ